MCCQTHDARDQLDRLRGLDVDALLVTSNMQVRCQCAFGHPCLRAATAEDFRCDWCRSVDTANGVKGDHSRQCGEMAGQLSGSMGLRFQL